MHPARELSLQSNIASDTSAVVLPKAGVNDGAMRQLIEGIRATRRELRDHDLYDHLHNLAAVRLFMEHHIFAVWDFMCLVKSLQRSLTSVDVPWFPKGDPKVRRLINDIVLGEESDDLGDLGPLSHFELYRLAMAQVGADCVPIDQFLSLLGQGGTVSAAMIQADVPLAARSFMMSTFRTIDTGEPHIVAAAFTFGREEPIPGMFRRILGKLARNHSGQLDLFSTYIDRHIGLDEDHHAPMAIRMVAMLCGEDSERWEQARAAALSSLSARLSLWDAIRAELTAQSLVPVAVA